MALGTHDILPSHHKNQTNASLVDTIKHYTIKRGGLINVFERMVGITQNILLLLFFFIIRIILC